MSEAFQIDTFPKALRYNYLQSPQKIAMREKTRGIWKKFSWQDYYENVKYLCLGLAGLGLKKNDKVSIIGENKPEWFFAELAVQTVRATAVGIYTDCVASEIKFFIEHSDSVFAIAHDQEQVDKLLEIKDELPLLGKIIYWEPKGLWSYDDPDLMNFDELFELGKKFEKNNPEFFDQNIDQGKAEDIAVICYTSGTTGTPKGAMLSQKWVMETARNWTSRDHWSGKGYNYLSFIPPAWATEQALGIGAGLVADITVNFPEEPETVQENLREIGPDVLFYGARLWEMVSRSIQAKMMDSTWQRRLIQKICIPLGIKTAKIRAEEQSLSLFWRIIYFLAYHAFFRQLRDNLGLTNVKVAYSVGAALSPEIIEFFLALGVEIKLLYASTELGAISMPLRGEISPETCGPVVSWAEVKIAEDGEILAKSKFMYSGYYKNKKASQSKIKDSWFLTGDFGYLDDKGHLIVIDRMEDLQPLATGKKFSPVYPEVRLRFSPYIKDILVTGGKTRDYVVCLVNIDIDNVGRFAEANHIAYTTFTDLSQKPIVIELIEKEIIKVNKTLPEYARIKKFTNLHKEFDADEAELTRTRKLRRTFVEKRYHELIDKLYTDQKIYEVEATVKYRDGRTGKIKTSINLKQIKKDN